MRRIQPTETVRRQDWGRKYGYAQRVHGAALRCNCPHLGVNLRGQRTNVLGILTGKMIGLIVDLNRNVIGAVLFSWSNSCLQGIELREEPLHALTHLVALGAQGINFPLQVRGLFLQLITLAIQIFHVLNLLGNPCLSGGCALFRGARA